MVVRFDFEQALEDERKALRGRLLERQNLDVVVVHAQVAAMAFEVRFREVVIKKRVVLEPGRVELLRIEVERALQDRKGFLLGRESARAGNR